MVGLRPSLSVQGVSLILGNDLAGEKIMVNPCMSPNPQLSSGPEEIELDVPGVFPSCAITHAMAHKLKENKANSLLDNESLVVTNEEEPELPNKLENHDMPKNADDSSPPLIRNQLIQDQQADPELFALSKEAITEEEAQDNPVCYFKRDGVFTRKWRLPSTPAVDHWKVVNQIVVPRNCRRDVLELAHSTPMAGHLGTRHTVGSKTISIGQVSKGMCNSSVDLVMCAS